MSHHAKTEAEEGRRGLRRVRRCGSVVAFGGAVLVGFAASVALFALLLISPASFVSVVPGWLLEDGFNPTATWLVAALSAAAAAFLALRRSRTHGLRGVLILALAAVAAGAGIHAMNSESTREPASPMPENTCVAYSGGHHTCPGG